ncbi:MAG: pirin family protein [Chloroherpetonaceae bacterium]|nr:pirin family protein [Chloroherpetonaceae bacterium]MCS7211222.1 pirin family protein [Chloroherpetonaceae bacterium]MDW8019962.1 pirin family protein [Chloroherpetonaceae bacterium]
MARILPIATVMEGEGFLVHRPFPTRALSHIDPFLLLDEFGPANFAPGEAKGTGVHPHKGFEILSYILKGGFEHQDSLGNRVVLQEGDVQWMTAGRGILHKEQPIEAVKKNGGTMHGFQVWVNLPASKKHIAPGYQEIRAQAIPTFTDLAHHFKVKVIIGEAFGVRSPIQTQTPIEYHHYFLAPQALVEIPLNRMHNAFLYPVAGTITINDHIPITRGQLPVLGKDGDWVRIRNLSETESEFIFFSGKPLGEPVARYGPFVMNTELELAQAVLEYQQGIMGYLEE